MRNPCGLGVPYDSGGVVTICASMLSIDVSMVAKIMLFVPHLHWNSAEIAGANAIRIYEVISLFRAYTIFEVYSSLLSLSIVSCQFLGMAMHSAK
jgi:hypothetical protein